MYVRVSYWNGLYRAGIVFGPQGGQKKLTLKTGTPVRESRLQSRFLVLSANEPERMRINLGMHLDACYLETSVHRSICLLGKLLESPASDLGIEKLLRSRGARDQESPQLREIENRVGQAQLKVSVVVEYCGLPCHDTVKPPAILQPVLVE